MARKKNNTLYESEIRKIKEDGSEVFSRRALVRVEQD